MDILALASTPAATRSVSPQEKAKAEAETTAMSDMVVILHPDNADATDMPVGGTSGVASAVD